MLHRALPAMLLALMLSIASGPGAGLTGSEAAGPDTLRALQPEDLFRLHRVGQARFSPDGRALAFERARSGDEGPIARLPERPEPRADIWIVSDEDDVPRRLTDGASDGTGWFHPRWSPDGERLAFLSLDGNRVRAWMWERSTDEIHRVTSRPVHLTSVGPLLFRWVSEGELAIAVRPRGAPERGRLLAEYGRPGAYAAQRWEASWNGREVTADVLDADPDVVPASSLPRSRVRIYETDGTSREVADGRFGLGWASPDGRWFATFSEPPVGTVSPDRKVHMWMSFGTRPGAVSLAPEDGNGAARTPSSEKIHQPLYSTFEWAPDGSAYAFLFQSTGEDGRAPGRRLATYHPATGELRIVDGPDARLRALAWTGDSELLVLAHRPSEAGADARFDWWRVRPGSGWENLTRALPEVPDELVPVTGAAAGIADGTLWRLGREEEPEKLPAGRDGTLHGIVWPAHARGFGGGAATLRSPDEPIGLLARSESGRELRVVRIVGSDVRDVARIPAPDDGGRIADVAPGRAAAAFSRTDDTGTRLFRRRGASEAIPVHGESDGSSKAPSTEVDTLLAEDRWLTDVEPGETRRLTYEGPEGRELTGWMILPPGRATGQRHPTVVSIYPGRTYGESAPGAARLNRPWAIDALQLLASRGYAVLLPSVPWGSDTPDRPDLAERVLPAVDEAVEAGLADSSRIGIMGHSYGGYGVNHVISQTDRFRAAVASAGATHLRSHYGTLDARSRYGHMAPPEVLQVTMMGYFESGQGRMGQPPFRAPERYRAASPLTYVDDVNTPLLMIHGDQDFVPVQQSEMLFTELLRQGKRARLVRYAGEGHTVNGRANVVDMWRRMYEWWDEFLGEAATS